MSPWLAWVLEVDENGWWEGDGSSGISMYGISTESYVGSVVYLMMNKTA